ncbi:hypothetical protein [Aeromonas caviae]|uniref:hypothetical protein n=1 Tax=Aeromonas caviae TaxID=648 RepID=UPI0029DBB1D9|nr:hypothetical protein [Aeromonas caviae]MDX7766130.1 hypothetical protein [Aeromonas caviae]
MSIKGIPKVRMQAKGLYHSGNVDAAQTLTDMADAYEYLAAEYGRVMVQAGYSASREECKNEALAWLDPTKRPAVEEGGI